MGIKRIASDVAEGLIAHWILALVVAALAAGIPAWGRITDQWSWPTVIVAGLVLLAAIVIIAREMRRRYAKTGELSLRIQARLL
jgi:hypothetical protein